MSARKAIYIVLEILLISAMLFSFKYVFLPVLTESQTREERSILLDNNYETNQTISGDYCAGYTYIIPTITSKEAFFSYSDYLSINVYSVNAHGKSPLVSKQIPYPILYIFQKIKITIPKSISIQNPECLIVIKSNTNKGLVKIPISDGNSYSSGQLIQENYLIEGDLSFAIQKQINLNEISSRSISVFPNILVLLGLTFLYSLIGIFVQVAIIGKSSNIVMDITIGLSTMIIFMFLLSIIKVPFTITASAIFLLAILFFVIIRTIIEVKPIENINFFTILFQKVGMYYQKKVCTSDIISIAIFIFAIYVKLLQVINLPAPPWLDSFFHAYIIKGFTESGKIPLDLNYPFGFHVIAYINSIFFSWSIPQCILLTGQWLITISCLALYKLTKSITHRNSIAIFTMIIFCFISPFPSYLINWARFSIVLGFIFSVGIFLLIIKAQKFYRLLPIIVLSLVMTHYATILFTIFIVLFAWISKSGWNTVYTSTFKKFRDINRKWTLLVIPPFLFLISRIINLIIEGEFSSIVKENRLLTSSIDFQYYFQLMIQGNGILFFLFAILGIIFLVIRERELFYSLFSWIIPMSIFILMQIIIIGGSFPGPNNLFIWIFVPLSISGGYVFSLFETKFDHVFGKKQKLFTVLIAAFTIFFAIANIGFLNPKTVIATSNDLQAWYWINENIPAGNTFLVNSFPWGEDTLPSDGGGWLPYFSENNIWFPRNSFDIKKLNESISSKEINYYYQGNGTNWFRYDEFSEVLEKSSLIYKENNIKIYMLSEQDN